MDIFDPLSQEDTRYTQSFQPMNGIGFHLFRSPLEGARISVQNNWELQTEMGVSSYEMKRSATSLIHSINPGRYVIIPTAFERGKLGPFTLAAWLSYAVDLEPL